MDYTKATEVRAKFESKEITFRQALIELKNDFNNGAYYVLELMKVHNLQVDEYEKLLKFLETYDDIKAHFNSILGKNDEDRKIIFEIFKNNKDTRLLEIIAQTKELENNIISYATEHMDYKILKLMNNEGLTSIKTLVNSIKSNNCVRPHSKEINKNCIDCTKEYYECDYYSDYTDLILDLFLSITTESDKELRKEIFDIVMSHKNIIVDILIIIYYDEIVPINDYNQKGYKFTKEELTEIYKLKYKEIFSDEISAYSFYRNYKNFIKYGAKEKYIKILVDKIIKNDWNLTRLADIILNDKKLKLSENMIEKLESYIMLHKIAGDS